VSTGNLTREASPLPMTREEMEQLGWDALDVLLVTGDAYVDHPSFGVALLGRWLMANGCRVGIVAQPRWDTPDDIARLGRPRLFAGVTAGALDSMLAHYTAFRKKRHDDAYTPGGPHGARPNRACIVYTSLVRQAFPGLPVVLGGIEASLRRATHYDFWTDKIRRSILLDSKADLVVYGMGERAIIEIAERLRDHPEDSLHGIPGTVFVTRDTAALSPAFNLPSHEAIQADAGKLMKATLALEGLVHDGATWGVQETGGRKVVFAPPAAPLDAGELDRLYELPFTRQPHPSYSEPIPSADMIRFSITSHRGCAGGCSFCSLALHQGRTIRSRSAASIEAETRSMTAHPDWTGSITDVGGPSANMWGARCIKRERARREKAPFECGRASCLAPDICPQFKTEQAELAGLLRKLGKVPGVKHVRVASGVRFDLALQDDRYLKSLVSDYVGGQLKIAPEHSGDRVLRLMRKAPFDVFEEFLTVFERISREAGKEQYVVPYLMSAFPGCTDDDMRALSRWLKQKGWKPRQVQCFIPTPGTVATAMFHADIDPDGRSIHVAKTDAERLRQHGILMPGDGGPPRKPGRPGPKPKTRRRR
jgi:uncharacterized radical SAM protein YgiQ